ncbi:hypothetical protein [Cupriavidus gilardii]|uniref:hypothetical protein n=1 Tax=Cupriavidus gilardii TaxID=82541 RepID=UPI001EE508EC|nr:hypothetical protein [Cupriavidus gilardii]MCG5258819.1 hypothetical protein [Cupriavidus gilardii]
MTFRFYPSSIALAIAAAALSGCATRQGDGNTGGVTSAGDARTAPTPIGMSLGDINHRHPMLEDGPRPRPSARQNDPFVDR